MADYIISERTPLLLSLSLSFSLSPSARPLPPQKRTHCYKEQKKKRGVWLHVSYIVTCLFLFSLWPPHLPSSLFSPLSRSLFLYPPHPPQPLKSGSVTNPTDLPGVTVTCQITRNNSRFLHCRPRHKSIKYGHLIFSGAPTVVLQKKKKRNYFGAAAVGLGTRLYIYLCVCERVRVYECWGGIEREREWVREGGWENLPQPCPDLHQIVLLKKLTTCGGDGNRSGYAKPRFHL